MNRFQRAEFVSDILSRLDALPQAWGMDEDDSAENTWLISLEKAKACVDAANRSISLSGFAMDCPEGDCVGDGTCRAGYCARRDLPEPVE